jgi:hypothetical protein
MTSSPVSGTRVASASTSSSGAPVAATGAPQLEHQLESRDTWRRQLEHSMGHFWIDSGW